MIMVSVLFDDQCGLCSKEIAYYQKITPPNSISWCPLSQSQGVLQEQNIDLVDALKHLHAIDEDSTKNEKRIHKGVDAFIIIWNHLPSWRWISKIAQFKPIYWLLKLGYSVFAKWRFKRSAHCQIVAQKRK